MGGLCFWWCPVRARLRKGRALCVRDVWFSEQHVLTTPRVRAKWMNTDRSHARVPHRTSPWRAVVSARLGGISTGALSNLLPTASIGRLGASQHDPPAPASNAPSFSVVSSVADSVLGGGAPAALASPRGSTSSARRSARSRSSAPPDVSMVVTRPLAGTGSTSQASHPGRRASSGRGAGARDLLSKPACRRMHGRSETFPAAGMAALPPLTPGGQVL